MIYRFARFELDPAQFELRRDGQTQTAEPQTLSLLIYLIAQQGKLVTKDDMIEHVWDGRIVSDSALSSCVKCVRQLLGDDGIQQKYVKTVHGKGFRFIGEIEIDDNHSNALATLPKMSASEQSSPVSTRPSIAVLPFRLVGAAGHHSHVAEALPAEIITEMARLRWLFVISRGSSFQLSPSVVDVTEIGSTLRVRYVLSGTVEVVGDKMTVTVELADAHSGEVVWAERYASNIDGVHEIRQEITTGIVTSLEVQIPMHEAHKARLSSPANLDAWASFHLGLGHIYHFAKDDTAKALNYFEQAVDREPGFARGHAGISFAHYQNAFLHFTPDVKAELAMAHRHAEQATSYDPLDPFACLTMGRVLWLQHDVSGSLDWLNRSVAQSPSYSQALYARSWSFIVKGEADDASYSIEQAMAHSPLDPLLYGMCSVRSAAHFLRGEKEEAATWAEKSAQSPGAHALQWVFSAAFLEDAGKSDQAAKWVAKAREQYPGITSAELLRNMPIENEDVQNRISTALSKHGI